MDVWFGAMRPQLAVHHPRRGPHEQNEDSGLAWETLTEEIGEIT